MLATRKTIVTGIEASPLDGITRTVNGNGSVTDYRFDQAGRLAGIEHAPTINNTTGAIFRASYQYDAGRRLVSSVIWGQVFHYHIRNAILLAWHAP